MKNRIRDLRRLTADGIALVMELEMVGFPKAADQAAKMLLAGKDFEEVNRLAASGVTCSGKFS